MLAELHPKAQITIPKEIIVKLGLSECDKMVILRSWPSRHIKIVLIAEATHPKNGVSLYYKAPVSCMENRDD